jgi:hypothetical protein
VDGTNWYHTLVCSGVGSVLVMLRSYSIAVDDMLGVGLVVSSAV